VLPKLRASAPSVRAMPPKRRVASMGDPVLGRGAAGSGTPGLAMTPPRTSVLDPIVVVTPKAPDALVDVVVPFDGWVVDVAPRRGPVVEDDDEPGTVELVEDDDEPGTVELVEDDDEPGTVELVEDGVQVGLVTVLVSNVTASFRASN
jgi:hypothetical protein